MRKGKVIAAGCIAPLILLVFLAFQIDKPVTTQTVLDRHHKIIGSVNRAHLGYEFWTPLPDIPPSIIEATLNREDRFFWWHIGVNPVSLFKALISDIQAKKMVRGGSTLTQQLAKILLQEKMGQYRQRTFLNKLVETALALGLELKDSKKYILERYLNSVYYGNQCYGITAAAKYYFGKNLPELNSDEISKLVLLPQNPSRAKEIIPNALGAKCLQVARHFIEWATKNNESPIIETTLDLDLQEYLENNVLTLLANRSKDDPLLNVGIVVLDIAHGELRAMVGSRDYFDESIDGTYNTALALRQAGSALKPFTYFLAFSKGYTPKSLIIDQPQSFTNATDPTSDPYVPQNFDHLYHGSVSLRAALANSYNVPAVFLLNQMGVGPYLDLLHQFGLTSLDQPPQHYGLSLTLGSGEVSLLDLTNAYAALARGGFYQRVNYLGSQPHFEPQEIIPHATTYASMVTDVLSDAQARIPAFGFNEDLIVEGETVAVKTGTSYNYNDNWALGYNKNFAVGVWMGHNDNSPLFQTTGASGAGPIWHATIEHIIRDKTLSPLRLAGSSPSAFKHGTKIHREKFPSLISPHDWQILSPLANNYYRLKPYIPKEHQQILAKISGAAKKETQWYLDGMLVGVSNNNEFWIAPAEGDHVLEVVAANSHKKIHFHVLEDS